MNTTLISKATNRRLHALLAKTGQMDNKVELVHSFSQQRTASSQDLMEFEALNIIAFLEDKFKTEQGSDPADRMRKKILAICHTMQWYKRGANDNLILKDGRPVLDFDRINKFCKNKGPFKKALQDHTEQQLTRLVTVFEKLSKSN